MLSRILKDQGIDKKEFPPRMVLSRISSHVNRLEGVETLENQPGDARAQVIARVWKRYEKRKAELKVVDFDDMLSRTLGALKNSDTVRRAVSRRARWLLVDEFQDTNRLQMELLRTIITKDGNITAVGDEDQSIYRWRGAEMSNILDFDQHFTGAQLVTLEQNYRSTQPILDISGDLISNNQRRHAKKLFTEEKTGEPVQLHIADDERHEARWTTDRIEELIPEHGPEQIVVLMRTNAQTRPFEEELTRRQIPYQVVGGLRFWQRAEVKDALAYLRLVVRPDDEVAFRRVVNVPARGIGAATLDVLQRHAEKTLSTLPVAARELPDQLTPRARLALSRFFELLDEARGQQGVLEPADFVGWLLEESGLLGLYDGEDEDKVMRRENLRQLASAVAESAAQGQDIDAFLDGVALFEDSDERATSKTVKLMTLHGAKGLEFDAVFIAGLEDGLLPHANSRDDSEGLEEERRLVYVGMTRARRRLALTAARQRFLFGQRQMTRPSRFLAEVPQSRYHDVSDIPVDLQNGDWAGGESGRATFMNHDRGQRAPMAPATTGVPRTGTSAGAGTARRTGRKIAPTVVDGAGQGWRPGDRVRHGRFGTGVVLSCQGRGPQLKLVVYFDRDGRKTLVPTIAKLEKV